jgi:predicted DNA-binding transcriptional regulator YafY
VRLRYREGGTVVRRTADPLGLVLKGGAWYLVARRSVGMRVYRVSRVAAVRRLDESFERPRQFELAEFWQQWSLEFEQNRPRVDVTVRMGDERRVMTFEDLGDAQRELLRLGARVEVLEPLELRERLAETSRKLAALYAR